jgi:23S rRNA (adenine2503-C2)-methyltransferase
MSTTLISNVVSGTPESRPNTHKEDTHIRLVGLGRKEIAAHLETLGPELGIEPKKIRMRTKQIFHWIYNYGVTDWDQMSNIAKGLRAKLERHFSLASLALMARANI